MFCVRPYCRQDIAEILNITDELLGVNYIVEKQLEEYFVLVAENEELGKCVGVCLSYVDAEANVGYVKTVAVSPKFSGQGIGTELIAESVRRLENLGVKKLRTTAWKHDGIVNSDIIFRRNGFVPVREIPDFWYEDSLKRKFVCPVCGDVCHCACVVYERG